MYTQIRTTKISRILNIKIDIAVNVILVIIFE